MKALVDADIVLYRAGFASEYNIYTLFPVVDGEPTTEALLSSRYKKDINQKIKEEGLESVVIKIEREVQPLSFALQAAKTCVDSMLERVGATDYECYLTDPKSVNFREKIATYKEYKGNRSAPKPHWYKEIIEYITNKYQATVVDGQEADDALGIEQYNNDGTIICSIDKDLLQIPGEHFIFTKEEDEEAFVSVSVEDADRQFYMQCLTGDATDNIMGCPKVGPKTAANVIDCDDPWSAIVECYKEKLASKANRPDDMKYHADDNRVAYDHWSGEQVISKTAEEFALEMAQLVRIRRTEGELWLPQTQHT